MTAAVYTLPNKGPLPASSTPAPQPQANHTPAPQPAAPVQNQVPAWDQAGNENVVVEDEWESDWQEAAPSGPKREIKKHPMIPQSEWETMDDDTKIRAIELLGGEVQYVEIPQPKAAGEEGGGLFSSITAILGGILIFIGFLIIVVGSILMLLAGFRTSVLWGLGMMFTQGIVTLIFLITHWEDAKLPFLIQLGGGAIAFIGAIIMFI